MADTTFVTKVTNIVLAWAQAVNDYLYKGRNPNFATTTGSANTQVLTLAIGSLYTTESDGDSFSFKAGFTNTGALTLQVIPPVGTNTARAVQLNGQALVGGEVQVGQNYKVTRIGTTWQLSMPSQLTDGLPLVVNAADITKKLRFSLSGFTTGITRIVTWADQNLTFAALTTKGDSWWASAAGVLSQVAVGTDGQSLLADSSQTAGVVYIDNPARSNLLINPNWQIDQVNEGALYTVNAADVRGPDGWSGTAVGAGVFKLRTLVDPDNAALKCLEITCTTADAAIAATDDYFLYAAIEGFDATSLTFGTASAQALTIQFKFKSNVTGVYGISIANSALNRRYIGIITVADTSEHEYVVTLTSDTSGTWLYTNGVGLYLQLCLSAGSNFQGTAGLWAAGAQQTTSAQANFMSVNTNVAYLKRIQLISGALIQAYRPADIQKELARAQRHYWKTFVQGTAPVQALGLNTGELAGVATIAGANAQTINAISCPVEMRATPTVVFYSPSVATAQARDETIGNECSGTTTFLSARGGRWAVTGNVGTAVGNTIGVHATFNSRLS